MNASQTKLSKNAMLIFLVFISAFPPITTDLYLPALPQMVEMLNTNQAMVNLTLSVYFIAYACGLLFWGPLSEKFGRKPIMSIGFVIYIAASFYCSQVENIETLIIARLFQAFGGSAVTVTATAIVKDLYQGREREKIMATIMSLVIIAPMIAPVLGAFLLQIASWHMMFIVLAIFGGICAFYSLFYQETLKNPYQGSILRSWTRLFVVIKNPHFSALLFVFSIAPMALMSFLAAGSYIYIDEFGLSEQVFSYAFAFNAFCASFGPTIYMRLSYKMPTQKIISGCYALLAFAGVLTLTMAKFSPWIFGAAAAIATVMVLITRIPGTNLMLEQQEQDTGSAVAIIQFFSMICGSLGMTLVSLRPEALIDNLGWLQLGVGALGFIIWLRLKNKDYVVDALKRLAR